MTTGRINQVTILAPAPTSRTSPARAWGSWDLGEGEWVGVEGVAAPGPGERGRRRCTPDGSGGGGGAGPLLGAWPLATPRHGRGRLGFPAWFAGEPLPGRRPLLLPRLKRSGGLPRWGSGDAGEAGRFLPASAPPRHAQRMGRPRWGPSRGRWAAPAGVPLVVGSGLRLAMGHRRTDSIFAGRRLGAARLDRSHRQGRSGRQDPKGLARGMRGGGASPGRG